MHARIFVSAVFVLHALRSSGPAQDDAFADAAAAALVASVRAAIDTQELLLSSYGTLARERLSVFLPTSVRDHLVYRREMAARLEWRRDGESHIEVLGAREYVPRPGRGVRVLEDVGREALDLVFDPRAQLHTIGIGSFRFGPHPLAQPASGYYRFSTGDTLVLTLADGRTLRLIELRVVPLRARFPAVEGSLWVDADTHTVVREIYVPRVDPADDPQLRGQGTTNVPLVGRIELHVDRIVIDHGFWEMRWWLPHVIAFEGEVRAGRVARLRFRYERAYADYAAAASDRPIDGEETRATHWTVRLPQDRARLLQSDHLAGSIFDPASPVPAASDALAGTEVSSSVLPRLQGRSSSLDIGTLDLTRYNRVEGVAVGARAARHASWGSVGIEIRLATAQWNPHVVATVEQTRGDGSVRLEGFHQLLAMQTEDRPLSAAASLNALLTGHDDGDYYSARGARLEARGHARAVRFQLYAQREEPLQAATDWSLPRLYDRSHRFRVNTPAAFATQVGAVGSWTGRGGSLMDVQWHARAMLQGTTGTYDFARGAVTVGVSTSAAEPVLAALELAVGAASGNLAPQHEWRLGGGGSLRGYDGSVLAGRRFRRGRLELAAGNPSTRLHVFGDVAGASGRHDPARQGSREAAGAGISFLDGTFGFDLARPLRGAGGWRAAVVVVSSLDW